MMGDDMGAAGGIATVARHYREHGLFDQWPLDYLPSYLRPGRGAILRQAALALGRLALRLLKGEVALLHVHCASRGSFWRKSAYCALARLFGVPYIVHLHGGEFPQFYADECGPLRRAWIGHTMRRAGAVIALSGKWRGWIGATFPGAVVATIGNPVAVAEQVAPPRAAAREVLFMGRMYAEKGVLDLIRATALARAEVADIRLVLAGTASDEFMAQMRALVAELGLGGQVVFAGWVAGEAKARLLAQCDVFALPSYAEGLPLGLLEAMVAGRAVVTTPVGGIPDVVESGVNGLLVAPGDVAALGAALAALLGDAALRDGVGRAARRQVAATFADRVVFAQLGELYRKLGAGGAA